MYAKTGCPEQDTEVLKALIQAKLDELKALIRQEERTEQAQERRESLETVAV